MTVTFTGLETKNQIGRIGGKKSPNILPRFILEIIHIVVLTVDMTILLDVNGPLFRCPFNLFRIRL